MPQNTVQCRAVLLKVLVYKLVLVHEEIWNFIPECKTTMSLSTLLGLVDSSHKEANGARYVLRWTSYIIRDQ